jgi:rhomboid protease GluP
VPEPADNLENSIRRIPARSHRQVMDWSLALASQGIEATISKDEGWSLIVTETDFAKAIETITQYKRENRGWNWRQPLPGSGLLFHWGSIFWCFCILWIYFWSADRLQQLQSIAFMDNRAVAAGQWWRLFTPITLHADVAHLAANVTTGFLLVGLAMARYGPGIGLLLAYLAGAGGNVAGFFFYDKMHRGLGASGMVMGALGLIAVQSFPGWKRFSRATRLGLRALGTGTLLFILMGTTPGTDVIAHFGGFVFGAVFGLMMNSAEKVSQNSTANKIALLLLAGWVLFTWQLALR